MAPQPRPQGAQACAATQDREGQAPAATEVRAESCCGAYDDTATLSPGMSAARPPSICAWPVKLKSCSRTKPGSLLKSQILVRTWADWDDAKPGFVEIDLVSHDGGNALHDHQPRRRAAPDPGPHHRAAHPHHQQSRTQSQTPVGPATTRASSNESTNQTSRAS